VDDPRKKNLRVAINLKPAVNLYCVAEKLYKSNP